MVTLYEKSQARRRPLVSRRPASSSVAACDRICFDVKMHVPGATTQSSCHAARDSHVGFLIFLTSMNSKLAAAQGPPMPSSECVATNLVQLSTVPPCSSNFGRLLARVAKAFRRSFSMSPWDGISLGWTPSLNSWAAALDPPQVGSKQEQRVGMPVCNGSLSVTLYMCQRNLFAQDGFTYGESSMRVGSGANSVPPWPQHVDKWKTTIFPMG